MRALPAMATVAQAAAALGYGTRTFYGYIALGELPEGLEPLRIRGSIRFRQADIMRILKLDARPLPPPERDRDTLGAP